ncbi:hypothetical protein [Actinomadura gamaensis]|uniref:Uncharacterized protein n=1 Tax=Actinomadura gamaensis TaxID=1763541 RepID=A0ABV9U8W9_9ACTN
MTTTRAAVTAVLLAGAAVLAGPGSALAAPTAATATPQVATAPADPCPPGYPELIGGGCLPPNF